MEVEQTMYVFRIKPSKIGDKFEYLGEILDEVSVFASSQKDAIRIIKKEFGAEIVHRLEFDSKVKMKLFGKSPDKREIRHLDSLFVAG